MTNNTEQCEFSALLDDMSLDIIETITHTQGPARAVQMVGIACERMAHHPETIDPDCKAIMLEIGVKLQEYSATLLEHMEAGMRH